MKHIQVLLLLEATQIGKLILSIHEQIIPKTVRSKKLSRCIEHFIFRSKKEIGPQIVTRDRVFCACFYFHKHFRFTLEGHEPLNPSETVHPAPK